MNKYKLTGETTEFMGKILYRIIACKTFEDVHEGELGGWIESYDNLSQDGNAWVCDNAKVFGNAWVCDNARVFGNAKVFGNARVFMVTLNLRKNER